MKKYFFLVICALSLNACGPEVQKTTEGSSAQVAEGTWQKSPNSPVTQYEVFSHFQFQNGRFEFIVDHDLGEAFLDGQKTYSNQTYYKGKYEYSDNRIFLTEDGASNSSSPWMYKVVPTDSNNITLVILNPDGSEAKDDCNLCRISLTRTNIQTSLEARRSLYRSTELISYLQYTVENFSENIKDTFAYRKYTSQPEKIDVSCQYNPQDKSFLVRYLNLTPSNKTNRHASIRFNVGFDMSLKQETLDLQKLSILTGDYNTTKEAKIESNCGKTLVRRGNDVDVIINCEKNPQGQLSMLLMCQPLILKIK